MLTLDIFPSKRTTSNLEGKGPPKPNVTCLAWDAAVSMTLFITMMQLDYLLRRTQGTYSVIYAPVMAGTHKADARLRWRATTICGRVFLTRRRLMLVQDATRFTCLVQELSTVQHYARRELRDLVDGAASLVRFSFR